MSLLNNLPISCQYIIPTWGVHDWPHDSDFVFFVLFLRNVFFSSSISVFFRFKCCFCNSRWPCVIRKYVNVFFQKEIIIASEFTKWFQAIFVIKLSFGRKQAICHFNSNHPLCLIRKMIFCSIWCISENERQMNLCYYVKIYACPWSMPKTTAVLSFFNHMWQFGLRVRSHWALRNSVSLSDAKNR